MFRKGEICNWSACMKSPLLSSQEAQKHYEHLKATIVDRKNPDNPGKSLMKAIEAKSILYAETEIDMLGATGLAKENLPTSHDIKSIEPQELTIRAEWKSSSEESAKSARDANVFGHLGVLVFPENIELISIPQMNALHIPATFLQKYGAELIPLNQPVTLEANEHDSLKTLYLVEYQFDNDYIEQYALKLNGGGGIFVETHPFPQLFTPLSKNCSGGLILGMNHGNGEFSFASFEIPFGYTMKINSMVIHGDSFFVGSYAIALAETDLADSVLMRKNTSSRDVQKVELNQSNNYPIEKSKPTKAAQPKHENDKGILDRILESTTDYCRDVVTSCPSYFNPHVPLPKVTLYGSLFSNNTSQQCKVPTPVICQNNNYL